MTSTTSYQQRRRLARTLTIATLALATLTPIAGATETSDARSHWYSSAVVGAGHRLVTDHLLDTFDMEGARR